MFGKKSKASSKSEKCANRSNQRTECGSDARNSDSNNANRSDSIRNCK